MCACSNWDICFHMLVCHFFLAAVFVKVSFDYGTAVLWSAGQLNILIMPRNGYFGISHIQYCCPVVRMSLYRGFLRIDLISVAFCKMMLSALISGTWNTWSRNFLCSVCIRMVWKTESWWTRRFQIDVPFFWKVHFYRCHSDIRFLSEASDFDVFPLDAQFIGKSLS